MASFGMKVCSKCNESKPLAHFSLRGRGPNSRRSHCKSCDNMRSQNYISADEAKAKRYHNELTRIERGKAYIKSWLETHPCVDCGESDLDVLQFDHVIPVGSKAKRVCTFTRSPIHVIQREIDKCEVRCANCHMRRTRRMFWGSYHDTVDPLDLGAGA